LTFQPVSSRSPSLPWIPKVFLSTAAIAAAVGATMGTLLQSQVLFTSTATGTPREDTSPSFLGMRLGAPRLPFLSDDQSFPPRQGWPIYEIPDPEPRRGLERPVNAENRPSRFWEEQGVQEWSQPQQRPERPRQSPRDAGISPSQTVDRRTPTNAVNLQDQPTGEINPANGAPGTSPPRPAVDNSPPKTVLEVPPPAAPRAPESSPVVAPPPPPAPSVVTPPPPPASTQVTTPPPAPVAPPPASAPPPSPAGDI
jgi:hypothetical protein